MAEGSKESVSKSSVSHGFIHEICDAYERDRQAESTVTIGTYIKRAPIALQEWILKELLAIEFDILMSKGEAIDREALLKSSGMSEASFDKAWTQLVDTAKTIGIDDVATQVDPGSVTVSQFRRGNRAVKDSLDFSAQFAVADTTPGMVSKESKVFPLVADDFELIDMLGEGGMGIVYRAYQHSLQRQVALKIIPQRCMNSPQVLARFYIEAEATAAMKHGGIVPVYEFGERNGIHYYAMALVEGGNLSKYVGSGARVRKERMEPNRAAEIIARVCEAAQYAHDHAVIHRDIKPANILLDESGHPMLADFGLAKIMNSDEESLTMTGSVLGTPAYMAPEQASGTKAGISNRTDVYALGATMYGLLAGRPPFEGDGQYEVIKKVVQEKPAPLNTLASSLPLDLQTICEKCLAKRPQDRYGSAREMGDDLRRYLDGYPISARPQGPLQRCVSWCRRNPLIASLMAAIGGTLLAGFITSTVFWLQAEESAQRAIERSHQVKQVLNGTFEALMAPEVADNPSLQPLRKKILTEGKSHYQRLIAELQDDISLIKEYANAQLSLGKILGSFQDPEADQVLRTAQDSFSTILESETEDMHAITSLATTHLELARLGKKDWETLSNKQGGEAQSALQAWKEGSQAALELRKRAIELAGDPVEARRLFANSQESVAMVHSDGGIADEDVEEITIALGMLDDAQVTRRKAIELANDDSAIFLDIARGYGNAARLEFELYRIYLEQENTDQADSHLLQSEAVALLAITTYQKVKKQLSTDHLAASDFAYCLELRAITLMGLQRQLEAEQSLAQATKELNRICLQNPLNYKFRRRYSRIQLLLATFYLSNQYPPDITLKSWKTYLGISIDELRAGLSKSQTEAALDGGIADFWMRVAAAKVDNRKKFLSKFLRITVNELSRLFEDSGEINYPLIETRMSGLKAMLKHLESKPLKSVTQPGK